MLLAKMRPCQGPYATVCPTAVEESLQSGANNPDTHHYQHSGSLLVMSHETEAL
jgi:hypothetical protein